MFEEPETWMSAPPVVAVVPPAASADDAGAKNAIAPATAINLVSTSRPFGRPEGRHGSRRRWSGVMAGCRVGDSVGEMWFRPQRDLGTDTPQASRPQMALPRRGTAGSRAHAKSAGHVRRGDHALRSEPDEQLARHGISAAELGGSVGAHV